MVEREQNWSKTASNSGKMKRGYSARVSSMLCLKGNNGISKCVGTTIIVLELKSNIVRHSLERRNSFERVVVENISFHRFVSIFDLSGKTRQICDNTIVSYNCLFVVNMVNSSGYGNWGFPVVEESKVALLAICLKHLILQRINRIGYKAFN